MINNSIKKENQFYIFLVAFHALIGLLVYFLPFISKINALVLYIFWFFYIIKKRNKNNEVLFASAYIVGSEVFLRMTNGTPIHEIGKYGVILFILMGMYYTGFSKKSWPYLVFLVLFIPGILLGAETLDFSINARKAILFNISGPLCLGIASMYTFKKKISLTELNNILLFIGLPIVSCLVYMIFYTPNVKEVVTSTQSNFETSGGFGPNQVSTILGLGMFIFLNNMILNSRTKIQFLINGIIVLNMAFRGMVTFSRGGMITGLVMFILLLITLYLKTNRKGKLKFNFILIILVLALIGTWTYASIQTSGLIENRYANKDALGREKKSNFSGREEIANSELEMFFENPILGVGIGRAVGIRNEKFGIKAASHSEITRIISEQGVFGILALLILVSIPFVLFLQNKFNGYLICFTVFWLLTINHAAMRTASPAFMYALGLLDVALIPSKKQIEKETEAI